MNKLLIHSNNTSFNRTELFSISEQFVFDVDFDKDVDFYIDEKLADGELKRKIEDADIVFIKVSLSQNYLEYFGIRLAYHIRLTKSLHIKAYIPVVFIAEESVQFLGLTYPEPLILFTPGIYLIKETIEDYRKVLKWYSEGNIKSLGNFDGFIKAITMSPPTNYQSHHSVANEWSILRWAKVLNIPDSEKLLLGVKKNIESLLYYKFLLAKYPIRNMPSSAEFDIIGKGKVLYIDDEWNKGWEVVLNQLMLSSSDIIFETYKNDFKDKATEVILAECKQKIISSNPDIVLLDLRLSDSDFLSNTKSNELTGYKVLREIKLINPGIQVLIFTASNKVWNFTELQQAGADGFILKESPELSADADYSKGAIEKLASSLTVAFKMSFLKRVYLKTKEIESLKLIGTSEEELEFRTRLKNNLDIAFKLLMETKYSIKYFKYAYLQLFQIIEDFIKLSYVFKEGSDSYVYIDDKVVCVNQTHADNWTTAISLTDYNYRLTPKVIPTKEKRKRLDTFYIVSAILIFRLGFKNSRALNWADINQIRNTKAAHFNIEDMLNESEIYKILNFIKDFIDPTKQKETNIEKGLKFKTFEESLELLKRHFK